MKAILVGSINGGFEISEIIQSDQSHPQIHQTGNSIIAVDIICPTTVDTRCKVSSRGSYFVSIGAGISTGNTFYGPFNDDEEAENFGERNRNDYEWEIHKCHSPFNLAQLFWQELLMSVESLTAIAEQYGVATLADISYLQNAIFKDSYIDADTSKVVSVVKELPSAEIWLTYIQ